MCVDCSKGTFTTYAVEDLFYMLVELANTDCLLSTPYRQKQISIPSPWTTIGNIRSYYNISE